MFDQVEEIREAIGLLATCSAAAFEAAVGHLPPHLQKSAFQAREHLRAVSSAIASRRIEAAVRNEMEQLLAMTTVPAQSAQAASTTGPGSDLGKNLGLGGSLLAAQDALEPVLEKVGAAALCQTKAVSVAWCSYVRRELCKRLWARLCRSEGQSEPSGVASITDLDVECLNDAGRLWEVVFAVRQLPQLARLHGYGFIVDVQAVREADLGGFGRNWMSTHLNCGTLRSCVQGEGQPPDKLLLAAVACAASETVCRVPVQRLREDDAIDSLDLSIPMPVIGGDGFLWDLLCLMLPAATSVRSLKYATACPSNVGTRSHVLTPSPRLPSPVSSQSRVQRHRSLRRLRARRRAQGDADHQPQVFVCISAHRHAYCTLTVSHPVPLARSLAGNDIEFKGLSALSVILKDTQLTHLECAAAL